MSTQKPQGVHLVGSLPLQSAEEVFSTASSILGERLRRVPDGETGERLGWIGWQFQVLAEHPAFEVIPPDPNSYPPLPKVKLRSEVSADDLTFNKLGYAEAAIASYADFARLKAAGAISIDCRFQVSLPTPLAPINVFVMLDDTAAVEPPYEARLLAELDEIAAAVPHDQLAVQWDVAVEVANWEGVWPVHFADVQQGIIERLVRLGNHVPGDVELGYHLCYGDYEHQHFKQPEDAAVLVEMTNAISAGVERPIQWIHLPVPRDRTDEAYFAPLQNLKLQPGTELYLGLVHFTDSVAGTQERIETAQKFVPDFGVATECGLGRRPAETIPDLLRVHAEVADPLPGA
jgi:hypothetical protein